MHMYVCVTCVRRWNVSWMVTCSWISSLWKWRENVRTPEVPLKQRCNESIKTRNEKLCLFLELRYHFLTDFRSLVQCRESTVGCFASTCLLTVVWTHCAPQTPSISTVPFDFKCYGACGHLEEVVISWRTDYISQRCCSVFSFLPSHFLSVYLWLE